MSKITAHILLFFLILVVMFTSSPVNGIVKRNEEYYPYNTIEIDIEKLQEILDSLEKLNDTTVKQYINEIRNAFNESDYDRVSLLLRELANYLKEKYGSYADEELAMEASIISSIRRVENNTVIIDIDEFIRSYKEIVGGNYLETGFLEKLYSILSAYNTTRPGSLYLPSIFNEFFENTSRRDNSMFNPPRDFIGVPSILGTSFPTLVNYVPIFIATIMLLLLVYRYRELVKGVFLRFRRRIGIISTSIKMVIKPIEDPIIKLYNEWYAIVKAYGFKRFKYETLREHLLRVSIDNLRKLGETVVKLYEDKVYGGKSIDKRLISEVKEKLNSIGRS
ncbi:MAG: hypothetical protein ABWW65_07895 [Thermoprotei archaeon]